MATEQELMGALRNHESELPDGSQAIDESLLLTERQRQSALIRQRRVGDTKRDAIVAKSTRQHAAEIEEASAMHEDVAFAEQQVREDSDPQAVRIVRYGREERIESSAAAEELELAAERESQLRQRAESLAAAYQSGPVEVDRDKLREAQEALLRGDDERSTQLMAEAIEGARSQTRGALPWSREERQTINEIFNANFGHVDDIQFADAQALMKAKIADPRNFGRTPGELVREVGNLVCGSHGQAAQSTSPQRTLKAQIPITQSPAPSYYIPPPPPPPPPPRPLSNSSYVESLRKRSGSNSSRS